MEEVLPESREEKYYDYSDLKEIDEAAEEYLMAAWQQYKEEIMKKYRCTLEHLCFFAFHPIYFYHYLCYNVRKGQSQIYARQTAMLA